MKKKTKIFAAAAIAALVGVMAGVYAKFGPTAQEGVKTIAIEVIDDKGQSANYQVVTDAACLVDAMKDAEPEGLTFEGTQGAYGLTIDTVNSIKADYNTGNAYWAFYVNDEYCNYGPDKQPVADGDAFKIEYAIWTDTP